MRGSIEFHKIAAPTLESNPLGDPSTRILPVYLPPGYVASGAKQYPTVYFLHGFSGTAMKWFSPIPFGRNVPERLDWLIENEKVPPVIAVFPDGWTQLGGSQWVNSEGIGRYRDFVVRDIVSWVDSHLPTAPTGRSRVLLGNSSGGYGALVIGRYHPDTFGHVAAHSADAGFEYCYLPDFPRAAGPLLAAGGVQAWFEKFRTRAVETSMQSRDHAVINLLGMAAAYSPQMGAPLNLDLPFEIEDGRLKMQTWNRWLVHDPVRFVRKSSDAYKRLHSLFIDCGTNDEFNLRWGARMVSADLSAAGVEHLHEEFEGGHSNVQHRFERSLSWLLPRVDAL